MKILHLIANIYLCVYKQYVYLKKNVSQIYIQQTQNSHAVQATQKISCEKHPFFGTLEIGIGFWRSGPEYMLPHKCCFYILDKLHTHYNVIYFMESHPPFQLLIFTFCLRNRWVYCLIVGQPRFELRLSHFAIKMQTQIYVNQESIWFFFFFVFQNPVVFCYSNVGVILLKRVVAQRI